jgi:signal transduction histidine kinase/CheY-like chemotaxis protein
MDCAKRIFSPLALAAVIFCLGLLSASLNAETKLFEELTEKVARQPADSQQLFLAQLELTDLLKVKDLKAALAISEQTLELAIKLGDRDAQSVARIDNLFIRDQLIGLEDSELENQLAELSLSESASPELMLHFYESRLAIDSWKQNYQADYLHSLAKVDEAQPNSANRRLNAELRATKLYVCYYMLNAKAHEPNELSAAFAAVKKDAKEFPESSSPIVFELVKALHAAAKRNLESEKRSIERALKLAESQEHRFYTVKALSLIGLIELKKKDYQDATTAIESALITTSKLHSERLRFFLMADLSSFKKSAGLWEDQLNCLKRLMKSKIFQQVRLPKRNNIFRSVMVAHKQLGNKEDAEFWESQMADSTAVARSRDDEAKMAKLNAKLAATNEVVAESKQSIDRLRWFAITATVAILLMAPWLMLYIHQLRFREIRKKLDVEREITQESKKQCEDLSLRISHMERMESLGLMAGCVAHDFNNILVGVLCNAEVLQMSENIEDKQFIHKRASAIVKSAEKAASLSAQMLAYAGRQEIEKQNTDLNVLIRQYEPVIESVCNDSQTLQLELDSNPVIAKIDTTQIEQVLLNFITNAVKASPQNGQIVVRSGQMSIEKANDPTLYGERINGGDFCFFEVQDNGNGISESAKQRIFEPFYTGSKTGRGLGLSVVYGVVNGHNGFVQCISKPGETIFRVLIPQITPDSQDLVEAAQTGLTSKPNFLASSNQDRNDPIESEFATLAFLATQDSPFRPAPTESNPAQTHPSISLRTENENGLNDPAVTKENCGRTILVVDEEEPVIELCKQALQMVNCHVLTARSGEEALEVIDSRKEEIDTILMDVVMVRMGADEVLARLELDGIAIPVVLMSGFNEKAVEFLNARPNVISFLQKPFRLAEIQSLVELLPTSQG